MLFFARSDLANNGNVILRGLSLQRLFRGEYGVIVYVGIVYGNSIWNRMRNKHKYVYTGYMDKYVVAVSGGVDSVVLLDILSKQPDLELIVAHFDHGVRFDSGIDAIFVAGLAKKYGLKFELKREELGPDVSEDVARTRRYDFLRSVAKKHNAQLVTAHHADDVIETIAINLLRGTGWRGLAVLDSDVVRLLTGVKKSEIIDYANDHKLMWHDDSTNFENKYLRNRVRHHTNNLEDICIVRRSR